MEELLAYAYMLDEGFGVWEQYVEKLDELFLAAPDDSDLLELELIARDAEKAVDFAKAHTDRVRETIVFVRTRADYATLDRGRFGRTLMKLLRPYYVSLELDRFGDRAFALWESLVPFQDEAPFATLYLADDLSAWENKESVRTAYEAMLSYYDRIN